MTTLRLPRPALDRAVLGENDDFATPSIQARPSINARHTKLVTKRVGRVRAGCKTNVGRGRPVLDGALLGANDDFATPSIQAPPSINARHTKLVTKWLWRVGAG